MGKLKQEMISFKADESLLEAMKGIANRSEFIRSAVLTALGSLCPLCRGTGILTPQQQKHWTLFAEDHAVEECSDCHEAYLVCAQHRRRKVHRS
ncbi:MAG TPA: ribbon-helix-helix domain-containing protein [Phycisphaerae bacterium]|nr:ribbon-helix-helix domain-containing protein [Phycisphaerae bacterium]HNU44096.1 ribbon-helix-helix domain-containing protein [Phycisphaerae bacterium]